VPSGHMMFGLTTAHAAGSIAMLMVGMNLLTPEGTKLADSAMLNGVVMMILCTCIISSITVDRSARQLLMREKLNDGADEQDRNGDDEKILLPLQHADDAENLVKLAIIMRNPKLNRGLIGLNVVLDDAMSGPNQEQGRQVLNAAMRTANASEVRMQTQSRLATNIANGIKHAFKENDASEIIMGLHHRQSDTDSFWGAHTQGLTTDVNRQIMLCRINRPLSTLRCIHVAIPSKVEYEAGFYRWVERLARMAENLGCRIVFHGRLKTIMIIKDYITQRHAELRAEYEEMEHWKELLTLGQEVNDDHLLVVITARMGTVSYKSSFEYLPRELTHRYNHCSLIILFPDQNGQPQDAMTFTAPQVESNQSAYQLLLDWIHRHLSHPSP